MTYWDGRYFASGVVIKEVGTVVVQGAIRTLRFLVANASISSVLQIPGGSRIVFASLQIIDAYDVGATITLGYAASPTILMSATDNVPQRIGTYMIDHDVEFPGLPTTVLATVSGAPVNGAAIVTVRHTQPEG